jgi:D-alanyl-D-alanine dipeptidase
VYAPPEEIPVLPKGTVQNILKTNQDAAKKRSFQEKKLIAVTLLKPSIQHMLRLSTTTNPLGEPLVVMKNPYLESEAAKNLARVEEELQKEGLSLVVYQAYIPWYAEQSYLQLVEAMQIEQPFHVPFQKNYYSSGCTVDVGLFNQKAQQYVDMGSEYLENIDASAIDYFGGTVLQRYYKQLLSTLMKKYGFIPYDANWWGYSFQSKGTILPSNQDVQEESTKK